MMFRKSLAGWLRLNTTVELSGVVMPEIWFAFTYALMPATVCGALAKPLQKVVMPLIVPV